MRSEQKLVCWCILFLSFLLFDAKRLLAQADLVIGKSVYVWSFLPPDSAFKKIAASFTNEFEDALVETGKFVVLQRRKRPRIAEQFENEKKIMGIKEFSKAEIDALSKALKVDAVIFGEITDDLESGLLQIRVAAENFDERILMRKSILFPRGLKSNLPSRQDSMRALVKKIVPTQPPALGGSDPAGTTGSKKPEPITAEVNQFLFELKSYKLLSGRNLRFAFLVTNRGNDGDLGIALNGCRIIDKNGDAYFAKSASIGTRGESARMVSGIPLKMNIDFGAIPIGLKNISLLELHFSSIGFFYVQFRDISIE